MKLSAKGRYAVMALCDLASHTSGEPVTLAEIAERQRISLSYLEQLFSRLRRAELVRSVRGPGGGYLLACPAQSISIASIVGAVDEAVPTRRCTPGQPEGCRNDERCLTHGLWEGLGSTIYDYLASVSLADVVEQRLPSQDRPRKVPGNEGADTCLAEGAESR